jgi:hypothetical protein
MQYNHPFKEGHRQDSTMPNKKIHSVSMLIVLATLASGLTACGGTPAKEPVNFGTLNRGNPNNSYLVCPPFYCRIKADRDVGVFKVNIEKLKQAWHNAAAKQSRWSEFWKSGAGGQVQYIQRTAILYAPDHVTVQFLPLADDQATMAVFSRSLYGLYDFGVNKKRVEELVGEVIKEVGQPVASASLGLPSTAPAAPKPAREPEQGQAPEKAVPGQ